MGGWLQGQGVSLRVPREGLWIGRSADCDLVVDDHRSSQVHALLTWRGERLELVSLGRNPTRVNDAVIGGRRTLADGDVLEVPGGRWTVRIPRATISSSWIAVLPGGHRVGLGFRRLTLGGADDDDIRIDGWPAHALVLHRAPKGSLLAEAGAALQLSGVEVEPGALEEVQSGTEATLAGSTVLLLALASEGATTLVAQDADLPVRVRFQFTATGGALTLGFAGVAAPRSVDLPELRARLFAVLLARPNEEVEDDDLLAAIWPGSEGRTRLDLNQLVHRARKDLLSAGIDPTSLLIRRRRGGAVCMRVAPGAEVTVD